MEQSKTPESVVGFQIPGLSVTVCTYFYSVCKGSANFSFSNGMKYSTTQTPDLTQLDKAKSSGSHHAQGLGITGFWLIGGCISLVAGVIPVHIAP